MRNAQHGCASCENRRKKVRLPCRCFPEAAEKHKGSSDMVTGRLTGRPDMVRRSERLAGRLGWFSALGVYLKSGASD